MTKIDTLLNLYKHLLKTRWLVKEDRDWLFDYVERMKDKMRDSNKDNAREAVESTTATLNDFLERVRNSMREFVRLKKTSLSADFWMQMCKEDRVLYGYIEREHAVVTSGDVNKRLELCKYTGDLSGALLLAVQLERQEEEAKQARIDELDARAEMVTEAVLNPTGRRLEFE